MGECRRDWHDASNMYVTNLDTCRAGKIFSEVSEPWELAEGLFPDKAGQIGSGQISSAPKKKVSKCTPRSTSFPKRSKRPAAWPSASEHPLHARNVRSKRASAHNIGRVSVAWVLEPHARTKMTALRQLRSAMTPHGETRNYQVIICRIRKNMISRKYLRSLNIRTGRFHTIPTYVSIL
jgi:hypothetical protein